LLPPEKLSRPEGASLLSSYKLSFAAGSSAEASALKISPHPANWRGSSRCRALDRSNRRMCLRCHVTDDELGCDWSK